MVVRKPNTIRRRISETSSRGSRARIKRATPGIDSAVKFLAHLEAAVLSEMRSQSGALTGRGHQQSPTELSDIADLAHVIAHWHDDAAYLDEYGRPRALPLKSTGPSLSALVARVYPHRPVQPLIKALLRTGVLRKRGHRFVCTSRHLVFPGGFGAYLSGLIPILGLAKTLRSNIAGNRKRLQQTVLNSRVPVAELPALYRSINQRIRPVLEAIDIEMLRRERRARAGDPLARVGLAVQLFDFAQGSWPVRSVKQRGLRRKAK